ncbi:PucR family transcriptional regulator [Arthrobacter halodurans]|uniref:PucR family transcriptional regulator n=1 Tax=Arthrobacter halodurans TaxID=516699 RepID=A0ABV4UKI5_9MICC
MAMTLAALLASPELRLVALTDAGDAADAPIQWAAVTELQDPAPFLGGGEVLLTTGLRQKTAAAQSAFVDRARHAGALALGYGTGLTHAKVPAAVVRRAAEVGLPVFEVPYATPFVAITRMIAEAIASDHLGRVERLLRGHQQLAAALLGGGGLGELLKELSRLLGASVALTQYGARVHGPPTDSGAWHDIPIATGLKDRCTLYVAEPYPRDGLIDYAQSLIGVELASQARLRESRRTVAGQVLGDLTQGTIEGQDAALRLQTVGIAAAAPHSVLLVESSTGRPRALRSLPLPPELGDAASAVVDDRLAVVLETDDGTAAAGRLAAYLQGAGIEARVAYGGSYAHPSGLRWSYFEAVEALRHGEAVNKPSRLSLTSLLLAARDVPLGDLAAEALDPLEAFDAAHGADLLATLRSYLRLNGSVGAVAEDLGLHRNTVRYRLQQISELSGFDPTTTPDRVQLWLALAARDVH